MATVNSGVLNAGVLGSINSKLNEYNDKIQANIKSKNSVQEEALNNDESFDHRLYRSIALYNKGMENNSFSLDIKPYHSFGSYVYDFNESPSSIIHELALEKNGDKDASNARISALNERLSYVQDFINDNSTGMMAKMSMIHPYALIKLYGSTGLETELKGETTLIDTSNGRRWYEIDGNDQGGYAKNPTTSAIIDWGAMDPKGKTPYSYQDFVFCKYWNKIPNNRMITLRRYTTPVFDNLEMPDYDTTTDGKPSRNAGGVPVLSKRFFGPVATAVTYFGEGTGNTLSELLNFSYKYNWKDLHSEKDPINISSTQNDEGSVISGDSNVGAALNRGLKTISHALGFLGDMSGGQIGTNAAPPRFAAANTPPDPYSNGPYENRIIGPINVIMDTFKRERGLTFTQDGLKLTFEYVSRPIAGVNNKAILLDLLSNILLMTYSNGSWFGGMWRYNCQHPAVYPWSDGRTMNKLYQGKLFGKDGAGMSLYNNLKGQAQSDFVSDFLKDAFEGVKALAGELVNGILSVFGGGSEPTPQQEEQNKSAKEKLEERGKQLAGAVEKAISRRAMHGATIPYVENMKALLTGDAVGEWHMTIGNPLNPIAVIGNLIVKNSTITFSDELGPDDFPIGFKAEIELAHGLGRDKEAIESMFNRGNGRIYSLPSGFRTSADGETKVDEETGMNGGVRTKYKETFSEHWGGGFRYIAKRMEKDLKNTGAGVTSMVQLGNYKPFLPSTTESDVQREYATYLMTPWQLGNNL